MEEGKNPLKVDSKEPEMSVIDFMKSENRFRAVMKMFPERAKMLAAEAEKNVKKRFRLYKHLEELKNC